MKAAGFDDVDEDACNRLFSGFAPEAGAVNFEKEYGKPLPEHFFRDQIANSQQLFREKLEALNGATVRTLHAAGRQQVVASGSRATASTSASRRLGLMKSSSRTASSRGKTWRGASPSRTCS